MTQNTYAVVGGGVSGIAAAHFLRARGLRAELIERGEQLGGRVNPSRLGDRTIDLGGKNIGRKYRRFRAFTQSLGSHPYEYFGTNTSRVEDGRLVRFDGKKRLRAFLGWSRKTSLQDIARFARLLLHVKRNPEDGFIGSPYFARFGDELIGEYFGEDFSRAVLRFLTVRMNGAEPDECYMRNFGSNLGLAVDTIDQLEHGMKPVIDDFAATGPVLLRTRVRSLLVEHGRVAGVVTEGPDGRTEERRYAGVVLATPAPLSAELVEPHTPRLADQLRTVRYFPVALVVAEYNRDIFTRDLRAVAFDEQQPLSNAGVYGINDLNVVRFTFSGRGARAMLAQPPDDEALVRTAEQTLDPYVRVDAASRVRFVTQRYKHGLCAYSPNRDRLVRVMKRELRALPGLGLTGDYFRGASIEACFHAAEDCVAAIEAPR